MYKTILIPTDGSEHANIAVEHAVALAAQFDATLHVLSVIDTRHLGITTPTELDIEQLRSAYRKQSEEAIDEAVRRATVADVSTVTDIQIGVPHRTITEYVDEHGIDLVVIGTHGRTRLRQTLLGSVAEQVLRTSSAPVLAVRSDQQLVDD
ncbi:universal stress protein [Haladaptatus sp. CMAA 1911]|uniref:universal stress protein n=1 Tax=unclassified Haladaptatus TaxID=2622732 RepID=UPI0037553156